MKRKCIVALIIAILLSFTACDEKTPSPGMTEPSTQPIAAAKKDPPRSKDGLSELRSDMEQTIMAIADFDFPELSEDFEVMDYLQDEYPNWLEEKDFIRKIPEERIIRTCGYDAWANLVCVVPKDPASTVCVDVTRYMDTQPYEKVDVVYRSETGEPILLLADISEVISVCVSVTDSNGNTASYIPYWDYLGDEKFADTVLDISPVSEKTAYENALDYGWIVPDGSFYTYHFWQSDYGYQLELYYAPGEVYDGDAYIYEDDGAGYFVETYQGHWRYADGKLHLNMENFYDDSLSIQADFPILIDPFEEGWLCIFPAEDGEVLPPLSGFMDYDELFSLQGDGISVYDFAISQGWRLPELAEILNTCWISDCNYAMDLLDDSVPGDNGGWATLYDVNEGGAFTRSYSGSWQYEDGMLYLSLVPEFADGYMIDDSFPVLMLDGELWIGRNEYGNSLPHFYSDMLADVLMQSVG